MYRTGHPWNGAHKQDGMLDKIALLEAWDVSTRDVSESIGHSLQNILKNVMIYVVADESKQEPVTNAAPTQYDADSWMTAFLRSGFTDDWVTQAEDPRAEARKEQDGHTIYDT